MLKFMDQRLNVVYRVDALIGTIMIAVKFYLLAAKPEAVYELWQLGQILHHRFPILIDKHFQLPYTINIPSGRWLTEYRTAGTGTYHLSGRHAGTSGKKEQEEKKHHWMYHNGPPFTGMKDLARNVCPLSVSGRFLPIHSTMETFLETILQTSYF